jgi:hypothetical protein
LPYGAIRHPNNGVLRPAADRCPIASGNGTAFTTSNVALGDHGYGEQEYFFEGKAKSFTLQGDMTTDGTWNVVEADSADFKSRLVVRRPIDAAKFNGSVIIEWLNVSGGVDADPGFTYIWEEVLREGYVWVGVSAQKQGIEGGGFSLLPNPPPPLKQYDPERYGTLSHPGDAYSFDIYTQAAQVVRHPGAVDVLGGLRPKRLIAYGESQSAMRLVTYVDGVHPLAKAYDGFFIHIRPTRTTSTRSWRRRKRPERLASSFRPKRRAWSQKRKPRPFHNKGESGVCRFAWYASSLGDEAMTRARGTMGMALLFGIVTGVATADARPAGPPATEPAAAAKERMIQWKLWVGKKTYAVSAQGGAAPLPRGSEWQCRYSGAALDVNKRNLKEESITLTCSLGSATFSLATTCSYPADPHKHVEGGVMPSDFQHVVLGGRTFVGLSCDVPGYELRTYRKR